MMQREMCKAEPWLAPAELGALGSRRIGQERPTCDPQCTRCWICHVMQDTPDHSVHKTGDRTSVSEFQTAQRTLLGYIRAQECHVSLKSALPHCQSWTCINTLHRALICSSPPPLPLPCLLRAYHGVQHLVGISRGCSRKHARNTANRPAESGVRTALEETKYGRKSVAVHRYGTVRVREPSSLRRKHVIVRTMLRDSSLLDDDTLATRGAGHILLLGFRRTLAAVGVSAPVAAAVELDAVAGTGDTVALAGAA